MTSAQAIHGQDVAADRELDLAERWRKRAGVLAAAVERGDFEALEVADEMHLVDILDDAAAWDVSLREVVDHPPPGDVAALMATLQAARVNPPGWFICRMERLDRGELVEVWAAEYGSPDSHEGHRPVIEIESCGDISASRGAPPFGVLVRDLRKAVAELETPGLALVTGPEQGASGSVAPAL